MITHMNAPHNECIYPSLVTSKVNGVREKMTHILKPIHEDIRTGSLQGQKALWKELSMTINVNK